MSDETASLMAIFERGHGVISNADVQSLAKVVPWYYALKGRADRLVRPNSL